MIDDMPLLTVRADFPRPAADLVAKFAGVPTGHAVDAMGGRGALDYRIKPVTPVGATMVGVAVTCHAGPADNLALFGALAMARPGDVLVAATDGFTGTAIAGDLLLGMARNRGVAGFVTDGLVRDLAGILEVGLPAYCMGVIANSPARSGPGTVGLPVDLGGVRIDSGDIVIGDRDGIVIVPLARADAVAERLAGVRAAEAATESKVKGGLELPDAVRALLASDRIRNVTRADAAAAGG